MSVAPASTRQARPECPRWFARFVRRLFEKRSADRWPDAGAALAAFQRRRGLMSPRRWRRFAAVGGAFLLIASAGVSGAIVLRTPRLAEATFDGDEVVGLDVERRQPWRRRFEGSAVHVLAADLSPERGIEVAVGLSTEVNPRLRVAEIVILSARGRRLRRFELGADDHLPTADTSCRSRRSSRSARRAVVRRDSAGLTFSAGSSMLEIPVHAAEGKRSPVCRVRRCRQIPHQEAEGDGAVPPGRGSLRGCQGSVGGPFRAVLRPVARLRRWRGQPVPGLRSIRVGLFPRAMS